MAIRRFLWDDVDDCVLEETDEHGNTLVTYTHEPGPFGPLLKENRGGSKSYYHFDALGSTTMLTDDTGAVTDKFQYDANGNVIARTGTTPTPYTWCGRWGYQDDTATTGGYYVRARPYLPTVARWTSVDPLSSMMLIIINESFYIYVGDSPVSKIDASGYCTLILNPASVLSHPWNASHIIAPGGNSAWNRWLGVTLGEVEIDCNCDNDCSTPQHCAEGKAMDCTISYTSTIVVDVDGIRDQNRSLAAWWPIVPHQTISGVYGHEQRHVLSEQNGLRRLCDRLTSLESDFCDCPQLCENYATRQVRITEQYWSVFRQNEVAHANADSPWSGFEYSPIGQMPRRPAAYGGTYDYSDAVQFT